MNPRPAALPTSTRRPLVATLCGLAAGVIAAALAMQDNGGSMARPLTVSARDCATADAAGRGGARSPIRHANGERWFCAAPEALEASWRQGTP